MNKDFYVYIWLINSTNEVFYVGKGKGDRCKHIRNRNKFFLDMYNSHDCHYEIVYNNLTEQEAFQKEVETIKYYKLNHPNYRLTNQTDGGEGVSGWKPPLTFRKKQSIIHKEQWKNNDFKQKMISIRRDPNGVYQSQEFRNKISNIVRGVNNPNYNNRWSLKQRNHLSEVRKKKGLAKGTNNPKAKSILCIETGKTYSYISQALEEYNVKDESSMSIALNSLQRTCAGKHWVVFNENDLWTEEKRFKYLVNCYLSAKRFKPYIHIQTKKLFRTKTDICKSLNIEKSKINKILANGEYMELEKYYKSHM